MDEEAEFMDRRKNLKSQDQNTRSSQKRALYNRMQGNGYNVSANKTIDQNDNNSKEREFSSDIANNNEK